MSDRSRRAVTAEIERDDGEPVSIRDLEEALEAEGYKLRTSTYGRQVLGREALALARRNLEHALTFLDDASGWTEPVAEVANDDAPVGHDTCPSCSAAVPFGEECPNGPHDGRA